MQIVSAFISYNEGYAETLRDVSACCAKLKKNAETYKKFVSTHDRGSLLSLFLMLILFATWNIIFMIPKWKI